MKSNSRRHDLDALRAAAMMLGLVLHAACAFIPYGPWPIQDMHQHHAFAWVFAVIHGFRMPLFFLLSGFFTAMLWRVRGLRAMLAHRFRRVFLPLVLGGVVLIPATLGLLLYAHKTQANRLPISADSDLGAAIRLGDLAAVRGHLADTSVESTDTPFGMTPLSTAAMVGRPAVVELLIARGAEVNTRNRDGSTALHAAAGFGRTTVVRRLLREGAKAEIRDHYGDTPAEAAQARSLASIRLQAAARGMSHSAISLERVAESRALLRSTPNSDLEESRVKGWIATVQDFPLLVHLWFLAYLCWCIAAFAAIAIAVSQRTWSLPSSLVTSWVRYLWIVPIVAVLQFKMRFPIYPSYGPQGSAGALPIPHVFAYYAVFFFWGALYFEAKDTTGRVGRYWYASLPICLGVVFPLGYQLAVGDGLPFVDRTFRYPLSVLLQSLFAWMMAFSLVGLFRSWLSTENRWIRYLSDASYWFYLAHLPLVVASQLVVRRWDLTAATKFALIFGGTATVLLLTYHRYVRYGAIGTFLNGPRHRESLVDRSSR